MLVSNVDATVEIDLTASRIAAHDITRGINSVLAGRRKIGEGSALLVDRGVMIVQMKEVVGH